MSELLKQGWKPKRTIVLCLWDGEEPGLLGSTEWAETHADELRQHAVAYINSDSNSRGYLHVQGSHTLENFMNDVARDMKTRKPDARLKRLRLFEMARFRGEKRRDAADASRLCALARWFRL